MGRVTGASAQFTEGVATRDDSSGRFTSGYATRDEPLGKVAEGYATRNTCIEKAAKRTSPALESTVIPYGHSGPRIWISLFIRELNARNLERESVILGRAVISITWTTFHLVRHLQMPQYQGRTNPVPSFEQCSSLFAGVSILDHELERMSQQPLCFGNLQ